MSHVHSYLKSQNPCPEQPPPDLCELVALANSLKEVAKTLLVHAANDPKAKASLGKQARQRDEGETRSYYYPPASVNLERELLRRYRADDFQGLLEEVHALLIGLVKIMQSVHKDVRVRGYVISSLGTQLEHASSLVMRMRTVYEKVMPVQR